MVPSLDHQDGPARRRTGCQCRTERHAGGVARNQQLPLDLSQPEIAPADEGIDHRADAAFDLVGNVLVFDLLDKALDHDDPQHIAVAQRLGGKHDADQDIARPRVARFEVAGRREHL